MKCPYLKGMKKARCCGASITLLMPSLRELRSFCTTDDYDCCPIFLAHILRSGSRKDERDEMVHIGQIA